ncbi:MAG: histidine--tRNA ligase [Steroidobacteraceae bacterium]
MSLPAGALQSVRGMNDILLDDMPYWSRLESTARRVLGSYGYGEVRVPLVEHTELFRRSIGEFTDIVEKEMYTFEDRGGDSLTLRPEITAVLVRAAISNGMLHNQKHRIWTTGPAFRYERPQKGRYRQFHQIDCEAFGYEGPDVDAEIILVSARLLRELGVGRVSLRLNSLGLPASRALYRERLVAYLESRFDELDEDSRRRLAGNPMRVLDSKNPALAALIEAAPRITDHLDAESSAHFAAVRAHLDAAGVEYRVDPRLVRGLDYYTRTVFEWTTDALGAQDAVCGGGRYDGLVSQLGGEPTPAIGWGMGIERVVELMRASGAPAIGDAPAVYLVLAGERAEAQGLALAEGWRDSLGEVGLAVNLGGGSFKSQLKRADRSGARYAVIMGDEEAGRGVVAIKSLRGDGTQQECLQAEVPARLRTLLGEGRVTVDG